MSAATRMRRLDESAQITVLERSGHVSFANCGLPYHVGGVIEERSTLLLQTPESLAARFALDVRVHTEATAIDRGRKVVAIRDVITGGTGELPYDKVVLSPGARPVRPPIPGIERALSLRDIEDTDSLVAAIDGARTAVVIGGGFIGIEVAENLTHRGMTVALVEALPQVMAPLDPEMATPVHEALRAAGIDLRLDSRVTSIGPDSVTLADDAQLLADVVIASIGVRPDTTLAAQSGLTIGALGGIATDDRHRTSDPDIYAIGDATEKTDALTGNAALVPLANTANLAGRRVADDIAGLPASNRPVLGTAIVKVFDLTVATTGWNEKRLRAAGRSYRAIHTHPASHAGYYPGAEPMALKLLVDPDSDAVLGAQGVGGDGVDKRIDVLATAITGGLRASALADLELAYAPPYGSAKDPVNMVGHVADNLRSGTTASIQWHELDAALASGATLLDVRTPAEHAAGSIPGAILVPLDELRSRLHGLPAGRLVAHCAVGVRGHSAVRILVQHGRDAVNLDGGYTTWAAGRSAQPAGQESATSVAQASAA